MRVAEFDYELPPGLIAQAPAPERDAARLLVLDRATGARGHLVFRELPGLLRAGDVLVLNDTKVIPARLLGRWESGGVVEVLLIREVGQEAWEAMLKPAGRARPGRRLAFGESGGTALARIAADVGAGRRVLRFEAGTDVRALMQRHGLVPLPPYIRRPKPQAPRPKAKVQSPEARQSAIGNPQSATDTGGRESDVPSPESEHSAFRIPHSAVDRERYQTVYAKEEGAIAAPTAGLHFTGPLLNRLARAGVEIRWVTLHVGPGTFQPIRAERIVAHRMEAEAYVIPEATAQAIKAGRAEGRRVVAVGTTVVRTLEHAALRSGDVQAGPGEADLFVVPGHRFRVVDALITNFHLPRSTLLVLVSAFAGLDQIRVAYAEAIAQGYRFYSYGDAMLIL
jgi:S-adenosylmethionine:tRNA ribosyltransferase-isomerase